MGLNKTPHPCPFCGATSGTAHAQNCIVYVRELKEENQRLREAAQAAIDSMREDGGSILVCGGAEFRALAALLEGE